MALRAQGDGEEQICPNMDTDNHEGLEAPGHQCPICPRMYKRREHLLRHFNSHSSKRLHSCPACAHAFQRADVLKRHLRTCRGKTNGSSRPVTRRRACERCVRQKKACNGSQPCPNCSKRAIACTYSSDSDTTRPANNDPGTNGEPSPIPAAVAEVQHDPLSSTIESMMPSSIANDGQSEHISMHLPGSFPDPQIPRCSSPTWQDILSLMPDTQGIGGQSTIPDNNHLYQFNFLDSFTSETGFVLSFDCGSLRQRQEVLSYIQSGVLDFASGETLTAMLPSSGDMINTAWEGVSSNWLNDPLALKTHQILLLIKQVVTVKPRNSAVTLSWSPQLERTCLQFFSPTNIRKFMELYWAIWAPNVNFVHRPAFDPTSSKSIVVAAMALIGACVSPDPADNENAKTWLNCVEEMVFTDDDFNSDPAYPFNPSANRRKIQAMQAAYMVCLFQNWEGTDASKKRIRRYRHGATVSMARDICFTKARHANYNLRSRHEFDWNDFVAREELIRMFLWIFLLDTAFVIFNNVPPRMVIKEMKDHMAAPEACFQAETADECFDQIQLWMPAASPFWGMSFRSVFESLCQENLTEDMRHTLPTLGPLNLFTMASAIHSLIFQYQNSFGGGQQLLRIRQALANWMDIWHLHTTTSGTPSPHYLVDNVDLPPELMWKRVGFCRFCADYWLLASLKVDRLAAGDASQPRHDAWTVVSSSSAGEVFDDNDQPSDPILNQYDQTSMRQVNDLISEFQKAQI